MEIPRTSIGDITYRGHTFLNITDRVKQTTVPEGYTCTMPESQGGMPEGYMRSTENSNL